MAVMTDATNDPPKIRDLILLMVDKEVAAIEAVDSPKTPLSKLTHNLVQITSVTKTPDLLLKVAAALEAVNVNPRKNTSKNANINNKKTKSRQPT